MGDIINLELKIKHNHTRCSKFCPILVDYENFLSTWFSAVVFFILAIMAVPLIKDPDFRRIVYRYWRLSRCYTVHYSSMLLEYVTASLKSSFDTIHQSVQVKRSKLTPKIGPSEGKNRKNVRKDGSVDGKNTIPRWI